METKLPSFKDLKFKRKDGKEEFIFDATFPDNMRIDPYKIWMLPPKKDVTYLNGWAPLLTVFHSDGISDDFEPHMTQLFTLLAKFYDFGGKLFEDLKSAWPGEMEEKVSKMLGEIRLTNTKDGTIWLFKQVWPHSVNFGDLCYSSDPSVDVEVTWRFKECQQLVYCGLKPLNLTPSQGEKVCV